MLLPLHSGLGFHGADMEEEGSDSGIRHDRVGLGDFHRGSGFTELLDDKA